MSFTLSVGGDGTATTAEVVWSVDGQTYSFRSDNNFLSWITTIFTVADYLASQAGGLSNPLVLPDNTNPNGYSLDTTDSDGVGGSITLRGAINGFASGQINLSAGEGSNGGSINLTGGPISGNNCRGGNISLYATDQARGGDITSQGGSTDEGYRGGDINLSGGNNGRGGDLSMHAGANGTGGDINTSDAGGYINTTGEGGYINTSSLGGYINTSSEGGYINTSYGGGHIDTSNEGGYITTNGGGVGQGGYIDTHGGDSAPGGYINTSSANDSSGQGGYINTRAGVDASANGGYIDTHSDQTAEGGYIDTHGVESSGPGGNINTSGGGGSINTNTGFIGLGLSGARTTLQKSSTNDVTQTLPDANGTVAVINVGALTHTFGAVPANGGVLTTTVTVSGTVTGEAVLVTCTSARTGTAQQIVFDGFVSSANTVTVIAHNPHNNAITLPSLNFKIIIFKGI